MAYNSPATLDQLLGRGQDEVTFNGDVAALAVAGLFGVCQSKSAGLVLVLNGGMLPASGGALVFVPTETIALTPSETNYLYVSGAGVINLVTVEPAWWPTGVGGAMALYELTVDADGITSGTNYLLGCGLPGGIGAVGNQGPAGAELYLQRKTWSQHGNLVESVGQASTTNSASVSDSSLATTSLLESVPSRRILTTNTAGLSAQVYSSQNRYFMGNAAGRGGFDVALRFGLESTYAPQVKRSFFGLIDVGSCPIGNVDPDTLTNLVGIGAKDGDTNFSWIHNDGSGTATMSTLGASFPTTGSIDALYELRLQCAANGSAIDATITRMDTGATASTSFSSDIPANTQFLGSCMWVNNAATAATAGFRFIQQAGMSRY